MKTILTLIFIILIGWRLIKYHLVEFQWQDKEFVILWVTFSLTNYEEYYPNQHRKVIWKIK